MHLKKMEFCGNTELSKWVITSWPTTFVYFMFLCHILAILIIFKFFHYLFWWSVVIEVTIVIVWGHHELHIYKILINMCVLTAPLILGPPTISLCSDLPVPWDTEILKLHQLITLQWLPNLQWNDELHISHVFIL